MNDNDSDGCAEYGPLRKVYEAMCCDGGEDQAFGLSRRTDYGWLQQTFKGVWPVGSSFVFLANEYRQLRDCAYDRDKPDTHRPAWIAYDRGKQLREIIFEALDANRRTEEALRRAAQPGRELVKQRLPAWLPSEIEKLRRRVAARVSKGQSENAALDYVASKTMQRVGRNAGKPYTRDGLRSLLRRHAAAVAGT
jgi:hypothetical protein